MLIDGAVWDSELNKKKGNVKQMNKTSAQSNRFHQP